MFEEATSGRRYTIPGGYSSPPLVDQQPAMPDEFKTALDQINLGAPTSVGTSGFSDIDALIRSRTPEALNLIRSGTDEALRLSDQAYNQFNFLNPLTDTAAFDEQQNILGLNGIDAQRDAIAGIPVSDFEREQNRREMETLMRRAAAMGDMSGATLQGSQQLAGGQQLAAIQNRLAQLDPLVNLSKNASTTLSEQAEASRNQRAQLMSGEGTQLANIRLGVAAPQVQSLQSQASLSGLQGIQKANANASLGNSLAGLAGEYSDYLRRKEILTLLR